MKQQLQRGLAVLLAVLMLACAFPFASFAAAKCPLCGSNLTGEEKKTEATCTEPAYQILVCSNPNCEGKKNAQGSALGHDWVEVIDKKYVKDPAYCSGPATYYKSCSRCKASAKDDANAAKLVFNGPAEERDSSNHRNVEVYKKEKPATCTATGTTAIVTCKDCGKPSGGDDIPTIPHEAKTPANCVDKAICKMCEKAFGEKDPNNHKSIVKDAAEPATCVKMGKTEGSHCEACKAIIKAQEDVKLTAHTPKTVNKPATCTEEGIRNKMVCSVCDEVIDGGEVLPPLGHKFGKWVAPTGYTCEKGGTISRTCTVCSFKETQTMGANQHATVVDEKVEATCTADGKEKGSHCGICSKVIQEQVVIPALGHSFTGEVHPNKDGTHSFKCERCNEIGGAVNCVDLDRNCICDQCKAEVPHVFSVYKPDGNATCKADGTKTAVCDVCGKAKDTVPDVGSKDNAEHKYTFVPQNDATCLANAHEVGTCALCGATMTREIENSALGHDLSDWKVPEGFNCTIGGERFKVCARCGAKENIEPYFPGKHTTVVDPAVKVTCTADGKTEGSHCSVCGEVFAAQAVIPAEGHKVDSKGFSTVKAASCEVEGEEKGTCGVCGETFTRVIPAAGHKYATSVVKPTCTAKGYTVHKCSVCSKSYKDKVVKATGHSWKITVKQATTKKNGTKKYVCTVCKAKVNKTIDKIDSVKLSATSLAKTGKKQAPTVIVKNSAGKKLKEGTAYTVKYSGGRKNLGTYKVTVTFIGNYKGSKTLKFKIVPAAPKTVKATANGKNVDLKWSKVSGGDQYIVYYSTAKDGKYKKLNTVTDTSLTVKNLKAGTYYFKVRGVRVLDSGDLNGILSSAAKVKVK